MGSHSHFEMSFLFSIDTSASKIPYYGKFRLIKETPREISASPRRPLARGRGILSAVCRDKPLDMPYK
jgi:hypothetical protein